LPGSSDDIKKLAFFKLKKKFLSNKLSLFPIGHKKQVYWQKNTSLLDKELGVLKRTLFIWLNGHSNRRLASPAPQTTNKKLPSPTHFSPEGRPTS
jgi:hypothetical protein